MPSGARDGRSWLGFGPAGPPKPPDPSPEERFETALRHAKLTLAIEGDTPKAAFEFRKHLGWYTRGLPGSAELRARLHQVRSLAEVENLFADYLGSQAVLAAV